MKRSQYTECPHCHKKGLHVRPETHFFRGVVCRFCRMTGVTHKWLVSKRAWVEVKGRWYKSL